MRLRDNVRYFQEEDWWLAEVPDIAGGQMTQGQTLEEARHMASDLVTTMLLVRIDAGEELDPPTEGRLPAGWEWVHPDARIEVALMVRSERQKAGLTMQQAAAGWASASPPLSAGKTLRNATRGFPRGRGLPGPQTAPTEKEEPSCHRGFLVEPRIRLELTTCSLRVSCSTN